MAAERPNRDAASHGHVPDAHLVEHRLDSEQVFKGKLLDVRRDRVRLPDGHEATREYVVHPGAVLIVPQFDDGRVVVERQFRYPNAAVFTEFPAGKLDPGETPLQTARRELREEAGYTARTWTHLGRIHSVVAYSTEAIELYLAQDLTHVGAQLDHGEFLDVMDMRYDDLVDATTRGEITDAKTVATLFLLERRRLQPRATHRMSISGRVQGVGFRDGMARAATAAGATGWVRNRRDGSVEALVQGSAAAVERTISWARRGPSAARVESVEIVVEREDPALARFEIRQTA